MADLNPLLLQALTASGSGQLPLQEMLLSQLDTDDPTVALITQMLSQRQTAPAVEEDEDEAIDREEMERQEREKSQAMAKALRHLRTKIDDLYAELEGLRVQNDAVAAALGACYLCWGKDSNCEVCQGSGRPGAHLPDQALFVQLVAPAVRRLQQARSLTRPSAAGATAAHRSQPLPN